MTDAAPTRIDAVRRRRRAPTFIGKVAKPGAEVKIGDVLEIRFGDRASRYEVLSISEHAPKAEAADMYRTLNP